MHGRGYAWREGVHGRSVCMVGGMHGERCVWRGHTWQGACVAGGVHGRGHAWQGVCMAGGMRGRRCAWQGAYVAGGMHGGGMHSCVMKLVFLSNLVHTGQ